MCDSASSRRYTAQFGAVSISTANSNRDGTGALGTVITGRKNGTMVRTLVITATGVVTQGMIRLFIYDGVNSHLFQEISVRPTQPSGVLKTFKAAKRFNILLPVNYSIKVSTENSENFVVSAFGSDWEYCECPA